MIQKIKDQLLDTFKLPIEKDMIRFDIDKGERLTVEYKDCNTYAPSKDGYTWKLLCARNCYDNRTKDRETGEYKYSYGDYKDISRWVVLILADKMLGFSQDINGIHDDFNLVRKNKLL